MTPCRECGEPVDFAPLAVDLARQCNERLAKQGQPPITRAEVALCPPCLGEWRAWRDRERAEEFAELRRVIARIVAGLPVPESELAPLLAGPQGRDLREWMGKRKLVLPKEASER